MQIHHFLSILLSFERTHSKDLASSVLETPKLADVICLEDG